MAPKKQQKMALGDFLTDQSLGSWADEMEGQPAPATTAFGARSSYGAGGGSGFGGGSDSYSSRPGGGFGGESRPFREALPLPTRPPFTAHLGNLSFDVTEGDIEHFLDGCDVSNIRIIEDKLERRPKGFAYVEFGTLDGLKKALELSETQFQGRNIRISVADAPKGGDAIREIGDWTRKGPLPDMPGERRPSERSGGYQRSFEPAPEAGDRGSRRPMFEDDQKPSRDFGNWERKGPLEPAAQPARSSDFGAARERRASPSMRDEPASDASAARPPRPERQPTAADSDSQWRARMKPDAPSPAPPTEPSAPTSPTTATAPAAPAGRPKLNLQKRTVSEAPSSEASTPSDAKASPFGAARPIDTRARDAAAEEKRQLALRQKKEAEDKAREEKKARETAKLAERTAEPAKDSAASTPRENGRGSKNPSAMNSRKNSEAAPSMAANKSQQQYEILRRTGNEQDAETGQDMPQADAQGEIIGDKETKPQEVVRVVTEGETAPSSEPTSAALEDDGFEVVQGRKKSRGGGRALAS